MQILEDQIAQRESIQQALDQLASARIIRRIWNQDHTVWKPRPHEITNRLGWLDIAERMEQEADNIRSFVDQLQEDGMNQALLMGMGGSSLAPEIFSLTFGVENPPLDLEILDSTDPAAVRQQQSRLDPERTLFMVATKSGTTVETLSFFKYFYHWAVDRLGKSKAGHHFVAITDPDSTLIQLGDQLDFRYLFINDPHLGGRYSALSYVGLVPAAICGADPSKLLAEGRKMMEKCQVEDTPADNPGALLGTILGVMHRRGRDKATFTTSPAWEPFPDWVEQLLAESTGKSGRGILPVVGETLANPERYGQDRLFIDISEQGKSPHQGRLQALRKAGHPVINIRPADYNDLGGQFFLWEFATAIAGYHMDIHPFNQPNVESAKTRAREIVRAYQEEGQLPTGTSSPLSKETLESFLSSRREAGSYLALQAFLPPTPEIEAALNALRIHLRDQYHLPTTLGFGPRFLHSTGQLHKGDAGRGLFIQFTSREEKDLPIPRSAVDNSSSIGFGTLKLAQALGDAQALREAGRDVLRISLGTDPLTELEKFIKHYADR